MKSGSVDDLRAEVASNLRLELKRKLEGVLKEQAMKGLREKAQLTLPKSLVDMEAVQLMRRTAANLQQKGMKVEDIQLTPDLFRPQAEESGRAGPGPVRSRARAGPAGQARTGEGDGAGSRPDVRAAGRGCPLALREAERLNDFEALAVEHNVVEWVLGKAQVTDVPTSFEALMAPAKSQDSVARKDFLPDAGAPRLMRGPGASMFKGQFPPALLVCIPQISPVTPT